MLAMGLFKSIKLIMGPVVRQSSENKERTETRKNGNKPP